MDRAPQDSACKPTNVTETVVPVALSDAERINYQKCAERCGLSLAEWMRDRLNLAAAREAKEA